MQTFPVSFSSWVLFLLGFHITPAAKPQLTVLNLVAPGKSLSVSRCPLIPLVQSGHSLLKGACGFQLIIPAWMWIWFAAEEPTPLISCLAAAIPNGTGSVPLDWVLHLTFGLVYSY